MGEKGPILTFVTDLAYNLRNGTWYDQLFHETHYASEVKRNEMTVF